MDRIWSMFPVGFPLLHYTFEEVEVFKDMFVPINFPLQLHPRATCNWRTSLVLVRCGDSTFHWPPRSSPTDHRMLRAVGFGSKPRVFVGFLVRWNPTSRKKAKGTLPKTNMAGWKITMFNRKCRAKETSELGNLRTCQWKSSKQSHQMRIGTHFDSHFWGKILSKKIPPES